MTELLMFFQPGCPYCKMADRLLEELRRERPEYAMAPIRRVNELTERAFADSYDYWNVPCFFAGDKKLYETKSGTGETEMRRELARLLKESSPPACANL